MAVWRIPCVLMRGGTSRGPFFLARDLPSDPDERDRVLAAAMGSGHSLQVDGVGGGNPLTSKIAIVGPATVPGADVDYLFVQASVHERKVDTSPNCGNMLAGVGPFAIESGLVPADEGLTTLRIHNVNTRKIIEALVETPGRKVRYDGMTRIDGAPGTAAPVGLAFLDAAGSKTGKLLPTSAPCDVIEGIEVSCIDAAMPVVLVRAVDVGVTGYGTVEDYGRDAAFLARLERLRVEAGARMGIENAADLVIPKPVLIAPPRFGGLLSVRYFMPHECHAALSVTGGIAIAYGALTPGTIAAAMAGPVNLPADLTLEHTSGQTTMRVDQTPDGTPRVYVVRSARRIFEGTLIVETHVEPTKTAA